MIEDACETPTATLYTFSSSHYCELARWALDLRGVAYREHRLAVGPHAAAMKALGLPSTSLPVLHTATTTIQGSDQILDICALPVTDLELQRRFEGPIGRIVRRFVYTAGFACDVSGVADMLLDGVPEDQRNAGLAAWPKVQPMMAKGFDARPECLPEIVAEITGHLDWFDQIVGAGKVPLGTVFGRSDITAASLLAPLCRPPQSPVKKRVTFSPEIEERMRDWSERPSLVWTRQMYADFRNARLDAAVT